MVDLVKKRHVYVFERFVLDGEKERLFRDSEHLHIEPQLFNFLLLFLQNKTGIVTKNEIQVAVWGGREVSDEAIRVAIKKLRDLLQDDAKAPRFIKTIPKQGYRWLMPIQSEQRSHRKTFSSKKSVVLFLILFIAVIILWFYFSGNTPSHYGQANSQQSNIEQLTSLPGSEVFADYNKQLNKLAFMHRSTKDSPQQIYIKDLNSGLVERLTWDDANYANSYWSKNGRSLAFTKIIGNTQSIHIADFDEFGRFKKVEDLSHPSLTDMFVVGWLKSQRGLILAQKIKANSVHKIYAFDLDTFKLEILSSPNVAGRGDYQASSSHDGSKLAILREVSKGESSLLILDAEKGNLLANKSLPFFANRLAWKADDDSVILSNFLGESSRYKVSTDYFDDAVSLPKNSLDVFASCGESCYILRQHNGNFLDIQETPIGINQENGNNITPSYLRSGRLLRLESAQDLPRYLDSGKSLLYVSLRDQALVFEKIDRDNKPRQIGQLDRTFQLNAIDVSPNSSKLAGVANGRLFTLSLLEQEMLTPTFLTNALERVENPRWLDNQHIYLTSFNGSVPSIMVHDIESSARKLVVEGMVGFSLIKSMPNSAIGIDESSTVWRLNLNGSTWQKGKTITRINSTNPHHWQVVGDILYYSQSVARESKLCSFNLVLNSASQEPKCQSTGRNRFRLGFDIHPQQQKALLVESLSAQSNIIRFTW